MLKKIFSCSSACCCALLLAACAGQVPPEGGPADSIPPTIVRTEPDTNSVHVRTDKIVLEFSEYVDRRSAEESVFISPYIGQLEFDWSGMELTINFTGQLRENTTYVVNLGTDVRDVRAQNRMASGFTLAFSTGNVIDQGSIGGRVFDDKPEGIMVFAYSLSGLDPDTLDPSRTKPDYIMQTGKHGDFLLSNLRFDTYRVVAVQDEYRNLIYDKQIDRYGVATSDMTINEKNPSVRDVWFRLSAEDTSKPFLTNVVALTRTHVQLRFSEAPDSASFHTASLSLVDTASNRPVAIQLRTLERPDSTLATLITTTPMDSGRTYRVLVGAIRDRAGNVLDSTAAAGSFVGVGMPDTLRPHLEIVGVRDSTTEVPLEASFELRFTEPVKQVPLLSAVMLRDSASVIVRSNVTWLTASSILLSPVRPLHSKAWYSIRVVMDSVQDFSGNKFRDSIFTTRFQTLDLRTTGTMEGRVVDPDTGINGGEIVLTASRISPRIQKTLRLREAGKFLFEQLPEGLYTLEAYRDRDSSRTFSYGRPFPFQPSERFAVYPDTIKVRARWGVEGVVVTFKPLKR